VAAAACEAPARGVIGHESGGGRGRGPPGSVALEPGRRQLFAHGAGEEVPLDDIVLDGDRLTWKQAITKPMRLNLAFAVTATGDTLTGTSRAGRLPASKVTGVRRTGMA
jgi:hypothetical protein